MPAAAGIVALSVNLGSVLVGETYQHTVVLLAPWLSASAVLGAVRAFYLDVAFQLAEKTSYLIWTTGTACVVNIGLDFLLIPIYGELGAAVAIFVGSLVGFAVMVLASAKVYRLPFPGGEIVRILVAARRRPPRRRQHRVLVVDVGRRHFVLVTEGPHAPDSAGGRFEDRGAGEDGGVLHLGGGPGLLLHVRRLIVHVEGRRVAPMVPVLLVVVIDRTQAMVRVELGRQLQRSVEDEIVVDRVGSVRVVDAQQLLVDLPSSEGREGPELVFHDRSGPGHVDVVLRAGDRVANRETVLRLRIREVLRLVPVVGVVGVRVTPPPVAARLGDHVHVHAANGHLSRDRRGLVIDLLEHPLVIVDHRRAAARARPVHREAVDGERLVLGARAVRRDVALLHPLRAADVVRADADTRDDLGKRPHVAARRHALEDLLVHDGLLDVRLGVDRGRLAGDDHRLLDRADDERHVDGRHEAGTELNLAALNGVEPLQLELHRVGARRQVRDAVRALLVGHLRLGAANQAFTADGDRHARHDCPAVVAHGARDRCGQQLCRRQRRQQQDDESHENQPSHLGHDVLLRSRIDESVRHGQTQRGRSGWTTSSTTHLCESNE